MTGSNHNHNFTQRELEILAILVQGHSNKDIARTLGISEGTVKAHLNNVYQKAGVSKRFKLAMMFKDATIRQSSSSEL